jgi:hypothetical protein
MILEDDLIDQSGKDWAALLVVCCFVIVASAGACELPVTGKPVTIKNEADAVAAAKAASSNSFMQPPHHIFSAIESNGSNGLISSARILRRLITIRS